MNRVILIGRLARDPEMRTTSSGIAMTRFTLAVSRPFNSQDGKDATDFISCVVWRRQAENVAKYCTKGSQVAIEGRIQTGSYDAQDGTKRYTTDVVCDNVTFLGSRSSSNSGYTPDEPSQMDATDIPTTDVSEDPFKDFGDEIALSDDDLPF
ncbi:MAG: single-stranded DNA-binding protein [Firmicutes bacterium]|nr:single-stranded DNA-binding protein [Bacillota bacterium]